MKKAFIAKRTLRRLISADSHVLAGCSGGADSQALLHVLSSARGEIGFTLNAIGIDHGLREAAATELDLAEELARSLSVPFTRKHVVVPRHGNLLDQARRVRFRALDDHAKTIRATHIALGHSSTDRAETVLLNLIRGASLRGAAAMPAKNNRVIRPLLDVTREEIRRYCDTHRIRFADDPTNDMLHYRRVYLRKTVLPALRSLNPQVESAFGRFADEARQANAVLEGGVSDFLHRHAEREGPWSQAPRVVATGALRKIPLGLASRVVMQLLDEAGVPASRRFVRRILGALSRDGFIARRGGGLVGIDQGLLFVIREVNYRATCAEGWVLPPWGATLRVSRDTLHGSPLPDGNSGVAFDADGLHCPFVIRPWRPGDTICSFGDGRRRKVADVLSDGKIPRPLRQVWPVITHGDEVAWVVGLRRGVLAPIGPRTRTRQVVEFDGALRRLSN